jgi:hypothetical protein
MPDVIGGLLAMAKLVQVCRSGQMHHCQILALMLSAQSAYQIQFLGSIPSALPLTVRDLDSPLKCQFCAWLAAKNCCLTSDNLQKRGWHCNPICQLCSLQPETALHLFAACSYSRQVWGLVLHKLDTTLPLPLWLLPDLLHPLLLLLACSSGGETFVLLFFADKVCKGTILHHWTLSLVHHHQVQLSNGVECKKQKRLFQGLN